MIFETNKSIWIAGQARFVEEGRDQAWAERTIRHNPAFKWVLGRYVEADNANQNGQLWSAEDLRTSMSSIIDSPINMLHQGRRIVGHYTDAEMLYPTGADEAAMQHPFVESLGVVYRYYFPEEVAVLERAHAEGTLAFSMECVAESVTCTGDGSCGGEFAYAGVKSDTYCEHINMRTSNRQLNKPHFLAGALLVPPVSPGWKDAKVFELSTLVEEYAVQAEAAYEQVSTEFPEQDPKTWEALMTEIVSLAVASDNSVPPKAQ